MTTSESFDYIVVGAGSAGCIVAAELSADPSVRVLLLEAGAPAEEHPETLRADGYKHAFAKDGLMWERFSEPQPQAGKQRLFQGSGRVVGGSGGINGMVYTRGSVFDYRAWGPGWQWDDVQADFAAIEERLRPRRMPPTDFTEHCIAAAETAGFARKEDLNDGALSGFLGYEWMNHSTDNQRRHSYAAFLAPHRDRKNLVIRTGARVERVLFESSEDRKRATGVAWREQSGGEVQRASARREVVMAAGALETPRILLLSGVGPADELTALGIPVVHDLPGVGRNLQDHPNVQVFFRGRKNDCSYPQLYGFHRANPDTALPAGEADTCYVFYSARSSFREGAMRLLPGMILPRWLYRPALVRAIRSFVGFVMGLAPVRAFWERMWGIVVILGKPKSRGVLRLRSADPSDEAIIDPRWFSEPEDLETLVKGVALARRVAHAPSLTEWGNKPVMPGVNVDVADYIRKNAMTTYHYAGTCRFGHDADSVADERLRVRGVRGLRIADASAIPSVPVSAMNAPSMLVAYRAARFTREDNK